MTCVEFLDLEIYDSRRDVQVQRRRSNGVDDVAVQILLIRGVGDDVDDLVWKFGVGSVHGWGIVVASGR